MDPGADGDENASEESFGADFTAKISSRSFLKESMSFFQLV